MNITGVKSDSSNQVPEEGHKDEISKDLQGRTASKKVSGEIDSSKGGLIGKRVLNNLSEGDREKLEKAVIRMQVVGDDITEKIRSGIENHLIGINGNFQPVKYIRNRTDMADLVINTKKAINALESPLKSKGGSANEVFITPEYVIKAEAASISNSSMVRMERFTQNIAHVLNLDEVVLPTIPVKLTLEQAKHLGLSKPLLEEVEKRGEVEVSLAKYVDFYSIEATLNYGEAIDTKSYQIGALFSGITQQTDHHQENGGVVMDEELGTVKFILFDNDICMHESNALVEGKGIDGSTIWGVPVRSFFLAYPNKDEPLSDEVRDIVNHWDVDTIVNFSNTQKDIKLNERQIQALKDRVTNVKTLVKDNPNATIHDCFKAMYPLLEDYEYLYHLLNDEPTYTSSTRLDCCILACSPGGGPCVSLHDILKESLESGKITKEKFDQIAKKIKEYEESGDFVESFSRA